MSLCKPVMVWMMAGELLEGNFCFMSSGNEDIGSDRTPPMLDLRIGAAFSGGATVHLIMSRLAEETLLAGWFERRGFEVQCHDDGLSYVIDPQGDLVVTDDPEAADLIKLISEEVVLILVSDPDEKSLESANRSQADTILVRPLTEARLDELPH